MSQIVHVKKSPFDVYCGRPGPFGNPFSIGKDGDRNAVIEKFARWIVMPAQAPLFVRIRNELPGKVLACWCSPLRCHCEVLVKIASGKSF